MDDYQKKKTIAKFQVPALYLLAMYSQKVKLKIKSAKTKRFLKMEFQIAIIRPKFKKKLQISILYIVQVG